MLEIRDLHIAYPKSASEAVRGVSFDLSQGRMAGLVGESGSGKTTIVTAVLGLLPEGSRVSGAILFEGRNLLALSEDELRRLRWKEIALVPQGAQNSFTPVKTIGSHIEEVLRVHLGVTGETARARATELLEQVELDAKIAKRYPHELSGGQKQRAAIALALACEPKLLLADEPTTALDVTIQAQVLSMMNELKEKLGTAMILITHDLGVVAETCDRVAIMYAGKVIETGTVEQIFDPAAAHHPYTVGLFGAIPDLTKKTRRLSPIDGLMPDPTDLPKGCKFHTRCPQCMERCRTEEPCVTERSGHRICCHLFENAGKEAQR